MKVIWVVLILAFVVVASSHAKIISDGGEKPIIKEMTITKTKNLSQKGHRTSLDFGKMSNGIGIGREPKNFDMRIEKDFSGGVNDKKFNFLQKLFNRNRDVTVNVFIIKNNKKK